MLRVGLYDRPELVGMLVMLYNTFWCLVVAGLTVIPSALVVWGITRLITAAYFRSRYEYELLKQNKGNQNGTPSV